MEDKRIQAIRTFTNEIIAKTEETLGISHDTAFLLLDHLNWDYEQLYSRWESEKDELLKAVHVIVGSEAVPSIDSSLHLEDAGIGLCPFCNKQRKLVRLYCGHQGCTECLGDQIRKSIQKHIIPCCSQGCESEIIPHDVDKILPHSGTAKNYKFWRLTKSFDKCHYLVGLCQNPLCQNLLVCESGSHCHAVHCPKCEFCTCLNCLKPAHTPLCCCKRSVEFSTEIQEDIDRLKKEEDAWYKRESKYIEYRYQNIKDLQNEFDLGYRALLRKQKEEQDEVQLQLRNLDLFVLQINTQIAEAEENLKENIEKKGPAEKIEELNNEINSLNEEISHYQDFKAEIEKENEARKQLRKKDLDFAQSQGKLFSTAVLEREKYTTLMQQYRENVDKLAEEKSKLFVNEDDYIRQRTVKCPSCGLRFFKTSGCNEITCPCGYEFCTLCYEPWITHKDGFYECPNVGQTKPIDYNDGSDYHYYPIPIDADKKAQFIHYKQLHNSYLAEKAIYDDIYQKFLFGEDKKLKKKEKFTDDHLCPFNKIVKRLERDGDSDAKANALKMVNNALFAQSIAMWGYGALYYIRYCEFTNEYKEKLQALSKKNGEFIELLNDPLSHTSQDLVQKLTELKEEVDSVLKIKF